MIDAKPGIDVARIEADIQLLKQYLDENEIAPLIQVMQAMIETPEDETLLQQLFEVFDGLGFMQGAVLTYAPYITVLLSDNAFDDAD